MTAIHPTFAYVGCFTTIERNARGRGVSVYRIDRQTGSWSLVQVCESLPNPGFLAINHEGSALYVAHGKATVGIYSTHASGVEISAYAIERQTGKLKLLNRRTTQGDNARRVTIDPGNRYVVLANGSGVEVFPINADGSLAPLSSLIVPTAEPGTFRAEEKGPHPHDVVFDPDGRFIVAPDKGLDRVHIYRLNDSTGKIVANEFPFVASRYGAAPRHVAFHPARPFGYVVNERDSTVAVYDWNSQRGELKPIQVLSTTPDSFTDKNKASEIAVARSGRFVYASNRGHDSIVVFSVNGTDGTLAPVSWQSTQGSKPRFFTFDANGSQLYAANENSDTIVIFAVDVETGELVPTGRVVNTESPGCIAFTYR